MGYSWVGWPEGRPLTLRLRPGPLCCMRWRRPARVRKSFPPAVILNRLAADFLVLMPFGRRISNLSKRARNIECALRTKQALFPGIFENEFLPSEPKLGTIGEGMRPLLAIPQLTRRRIWLAFIVAVITDGAQLLLGPFGWVFIDDALDVVAMILTCWALGLHVLLLPT